MKKLKYPQNIIILVFSLLLCFVIIFFISKSDSIFLVKNDNHALERPISSEAEFRFNNTIIFGSKQNPLSVNKIDGKGKVKLDIVSGNISLGAMDFNKLPFRVQGAKKSINVKTIKLDPDYSSTGKVNLRTGKIDLSVGIVLEMKIDTSEEKISLVLPLVGTLNRKTGMLNLNGAVTIPPEELEMPLPAEVSIKAISL